MQPLAGIAVVDFGALLAGPLAGLILVEGGAEPLKIARSGRGDELRGYRPGFGARTSSLCSSAAGSRSIWRRVARSVA